MLANLKKRIKTDGKWTFVPVPRKNGRFLPDKVTDAGTYYVEWRQAGKRKQEPVGDNPRAALEALRTKQDELDNQDGKTAATSAHSTTLEDARERFLRDIKATKSIATFKQYRAQSRWFLQAIGKTYVAEISAADIMGLFAKARDEGKVAQKTINLRVLLALMVVKHAGNEIRLKKGAWPKTADLPPEVYDNEELKKLFDACDQRQKTIFSVFLYSGFRNMEVATLQWSSDIDWRNKMLKVSIKPDLRFNPKSYEWRAVRVPQRVMDLLEAWKKKSTGNRLVFPSLPGAPALNATGGKVDTDMKRLIKKVAHRGGLNCGHCDNLAGKCISGPFCDRWFLHKFRHTFATNMLRSGVDIKSLQSLLGHKNLSTTEKYLRSLRPQDLADKIENSVMAGLLA